MLLNLALVNGLQLLVLQGLDLVELRDEATDMLVRLLQSSSIVLDSNSA
jgi:hypothetical protein